MSTRALFESERISDFAVLHPVGREQFQELANHLSEAYAAGRTPTRFQVFETWRHPARQAALKAKGTSKAGPWQSAHQYGLAVDFVPNNDGWSWADSHDWEFLSREAKWFGLTVPIRWDLAHVEHPFFRLVSTAWFNWDANKDGWEPG